MTIFIPTKKHKLTQARLKELLDYNPNTGIFKWLIDIGTAKTGDIAGCIRPDGYLQIQIHGIPYLSHRLAWLYVYGYFPENEVDHKDRIKWHNWISNLREVSRQCNTRNCGNLKHNTSGVKGVSWHKANSMWRAHIKINRKQICIGYSKDFIEAVFARYAVEQCLDWNSCDNNSPAKRYLLKNKFIKNRR